MLKPARDIVAALAVLVPVCVLGLHWQSLPQSVPTHFGLDGQPDGYGSKALLWLVAVLSLLVYGSLFFLIRWRALPISVPFALAGEARLRAETLAREMLGWIQIELSFLFGFLLIRCTLGRGLGRWFFLTALLPVVTVSIFLVLISRQRQLGNKVC